MRRSRKAAIEAEPIAPPINPAPTIAVNGDASKIEQARLEKVDFFDLLQQQELDEWKRRKLYIYRVWPRVEKKDEAHYLTVISHPIDEEWLKQTFGSGRYLMLLRDSVLKKAIAQHTFSVHDIDYPPKLNSREVLECEENARYYELWPPSRNTETAEAPKAGTNGADAAAVAVREMGDLARQANDKGLDENLMKLYMDATRARDELAEKLATSAKPNAGAADQLSILDKVLDLVERLKADSQPSDTQRANGGMDSLAALDRAVDLLNKLRPPAPAAASQPQQSGISQVKEMVELVATLKETFGGSGEPAVGAAEGSGGLLSDAIRYGTDLLKGPLTILTQAWMTKAMGQPLMHPRPGMGSGAVPAARTNQPPAEPGADQPAVAVPAPQGDPGAPNEMTQQILNEITNPLVEHIRDPNLTGRDFADWLIYGIPGTDSGGYGIRAYKEILKIGKQLLLVGVQSHPSISAQLQGVPQERITGFLDDFFLGPPEDSPEDQSVPEIEPSQTNRGTRRKPASGKE